MNVDGDDGHGMVPDPLLLDDDIEALLRGAEPSVAARHLLPFVRGVRAAGDDPAPRPTAELARVLAGIDTEVAPVAVLPKVRTARVTRRRAAARRVAGAALAAKLAVGATAAVAGVAGAGALHVIPGAPGEAVRRAIETVTPLELDDDRGRADDGPAPTQPTPATTPDGTGGEHGDRVSDDATGADGSERGVDGPTVADQAPGADRRAEGAPAGPPASVPAHGRGGAGTPDSEPPADDETPGAATPPGASGATGQGAGAATAGPPSTVPAP